MLQNIVLMPALGLGMSEAWGCCWVGGRLEGGGGGGGGGERERVMASLCLPTHYLLSFPAFLFSRCYCCVNFVEVFDYKEYLVS